MKAKWYGISFERSRMLMEVFKEHNEQMKALVNREFSPLTPHEAFITRADNLTAIQWSARSFYAAYETDFA
jgi:hypothetical protein